MGAEAFLPDPAGNILLVGESIVWGGNPYKAADRLAAKLQSLVKGKVWPISAGSWGLQNEGNSPTNPILARPPAIAQHLS
jgi:hypothetical protein